MPAFLAFFWGSFSAVMGTLVGKVLVSLGLTYVTYTGVSAGFGWAKAQFISGMSGLPGDALGIAYALKVDVCVSMVLSALTARLLLAGLTSSGSFTRVAVKGAP